MKQNKHRFMRAMLFIAVLFTSFWGVAASAPGLLTETDLPKTNTPSIYLGEGVGKYTVSTNSVVGSEVYCRFIHEFLGRCSFNTRIINRN